MTDENTDTLHRFSDEKVVALHALSDAIYLEEEALSALMELLSASEIMNLLEVGISQILSERDIAEPTLDLSLMIARVRAATSLLGIPPLASDDRMATTHELLMEAWKSSGLAE